MKLSALRGLHPAFRISIAGNRAPTGAAVLSPRRTIAVAANKSPVTGDGAKS